MPNKIVLGLLCLGLCSVREPGGFGLFLIVCHAVVLYLHSNAVFSIACLFVCLFRLFIFVGLAGLAGLVVFILAHFWVSSTPLSEQAKCPSA